MSELPVKFYDFTPESFPFSFEFYTTDGTVVLTTTVEGPGAMYVPPLHKEHGPVGVRIIKDGKIIQDEPPPEG